MLPTLIELQRLKRLDRTGWTLRGLPNGTESVAAHSFGVCVTAMMLADEIKLRHEIELNMERVLRMALVHDWAETRVGDMPKTGTNYYGADIRKQAESAAFADIVGSTSMSAQYEALHKDYEARESLEAKLVKAADVIDLLIQAYALERAGAKGLDEFWEVAENCNFDLPTQAAEVVNEMLSSILDARSKLR